MVWRTEQERNKKKVYTGKQRNLRRARTQRRTMETRKTKERSTCPPFHTKTQSRRCYEANREAAKRATGGFEPRLELRRARGGGQNILQQPGFNPGSTKNRINHTCNTLLDKSVWQNASHDFLGQKRQQKLNKMTAIMLLCEKNTKNNSNCNEAKNHNLTVTLIHKFSSVQVYQRRAV